MAQFAYKIRTSAKAKKRKGKSIVAVGKKPPLGQGGRFAALKAGLAKRGGIKTPGALAAYIGRKALGKKRFQKLAAAGKRRKR